MCLFCIGYSVCCHSLYSTYNLLYFCEIGCNVSAFISDSRKLTFAIFLMGKLLSSLFLSFGYNVSFFSGFLKKISLSSCYQAMWLWLICLFSFFVFLVLSVHWAFFFFFLISEFIAFLNLESFQSLFKNIFVSPSTFCVEYFQATWSCSIALSILFQCFFSVVHWDNFFRYIFKFTIFS